MGIYYDADLIWGIPVLAYEEDEYGSRDEDKPTPFWDPEYEYWRDFDHLKIESYGHYEDPDNHCAILTLKDAPTYNADCWNPKRIESLETPVIPNTAVKEAEKYGINLLDSAWYLVCSVG